MVDVARYFMSFLHDESCGKCTPCREGTKHLLEILTDITKGQGKEEHLALMEELCDTMTAASLCGLGQSAVNPVLSTLKYFREEYEAHILHKKCPALVCRPLLKYTIDPETCTGCLACVRECPADAIHGEAGEPQELDQELCVKCGMCHASLQIRCSQGRIMKNDTQSDHRRPSGQIPARALSLLLAARSQRHRHPTLCYHDGPQTRGPLPPVRGGNRRGPGPHPPGEFLHLSGGSRAHRPDPLGESAGLPAHGLELLLAQAPAAELIKEMAADHGRLRDPL